ncbi:LPXTG-motif cell wall-anchored protein [Streptomyces sp. Ag109_O5-1]|uniref:LAETG motif-containing sortase-dependent surface protein n=1 Tax=Streptomyces sp. Ag109_O5-1 TaxID=1938851 RepID=UPI000F4F7A33|nr:LAETG motif-containing sortase-dependent surface protein [Streptomyces sp. Ag109_O5-1]RPE42333.1 LPXTG-motif cell wall-anchored protein [Streptomyces sp. Ag109_O5-1]
MSIARHVTARRLLGTGVASFALCAVSVAGASGAWAHGGAPGGDGWKSGGHYSPGTGAGTETGTDKCQFSIDGSNFFDSVKVDDQNLKVTDDGKVHLKVRAAGDAASCTASLASYIAHGPTFATSGQQIFVDFDTVTVKQGQTDSLDIAVPDAGCFAQIDLYRGAVKFDGNKDAGDGFEHGDLPAGPDHTVIKDKLIASWNGGTKDCSKTESSSPSPSESAPAQPSIPATETTTPAPSESSATGTATASASPSTSESESTPTPASLPSTDSGSGGDLAHTGASSSTGYLAGGAAVLLAGGAAIVVATRRRKASRA